MTKRKNEFNVKDPENPIYPFNHDQKVNKK